MTCPECHAENTAGMRFCGDCAAPLLVSCQSCQTDNPSENQFCGQWAARRRADNLQVHMGIHTGLVVFGSVGDNLRMDPTAIGDAANIAARLQGAAEPGTIVISEETRELARGYARTEPIGALTLKGKG